MTVPSLNTTAVSTLAACLLLMRRPELMLFLSYCMKDYYRALVLQVSNAINVTEFASDKGASSCLLLIAVNSLYFCAYRRAIRSLLPITTDHGKVLVETLLDSAHNYLLYKIITAISGKEHILID